MAYRGRYIPTYPKKYKGDPSNIIYRSLWERKFMVYCDRNDRILEWGSEEFFIPYRSPLDGKIHRYFPDFYVKVKTKQNTIKKWVVEVKPKAQTRPPRTPKRKTKKYITEVRNYAINDAKWKNAIEYCKDRNMEFIIITEDELGI
tara:strand:- start:1715 stop:2149 length:435 start_codon:yes stop_codon:yes gene_type:complete